MKNIKVRTKLTIIVALVLVLVASESFISIQNMNQLKNKALDTMDTSSRQNYDDSIKDDNGRFITRYRRHDIFPQFFYIFLSFFYKYSVKIC